MKEQPARPEASWGRRLLRSLVIAPLRAVGWLTLLVAGAAYAISQTDLLRGTLEAGLSSRLAPLGRSLTLEGVQVDWIGPSLRLDGLRIAHGEGHDHLLVERLHIGLRPSPTSGLELARIHIDGGRVLISEAGIEDVRALLDSTGEAAMKPGEVTLPELQLRGFEVDFLDPTGEEHRLGRLDLSMRGEGSFPSRIRGRFLLPTTEAASRRAEFHVAGLVSPDGQLTLNAVSDQVRIEDWALPEMEPFVALKELSPRGRVTLFTTGSARLRGELAPRGELSLRLEDGALRIPGVEEEVEGVEVELTGSYEPTNGQDFWSPRAWRGGAALTASWADLPLQAGLRVGADSRPGLAFESWIHAPRVDTDSPSLRSLEGVALLDTLLSAVDPHGLAAASVGITCGESISPDEPLGPKLEFTVRVENEGPLRAAYHGWAPPGSDPETVLGFPMPAECDDVLVVFASTQRFPRRNRLDVRWEGRHPTGPVNGLYQAWSNPVDMPPFAAGFGRDEADLLLRVPRLELDEEVERHLPELRGIPELATLYDDYGLEGGVASAQVHVSARRGQQTPAVRVEVEVEEVSAAHHLVPIRAEEVEGRVLVIDGGQGASSVAFAMEGRSQGVSSLEIAGRVRSERAEDGAAGATTRLEVIEVQAGGVELDGAVVDRLTELDEDLGASLSSYGASGRVAVVARQVASPDQPRSLSLELDSGGRVEVRPEVFPVPARDVRGRVLVDLREQEAGGDLSARVRLAPLIGRWPGDLPVAMTASFGGDPGPSGAIHGAGAPIGDRALLGELLAGLGERAAEAVEGLAAVDLRGAVDFEYRFEPDSEAATDEVEQDATLRLRSNALVQRAGLELEELTGTLRLSEGALSGDQLRGRLAGTPVTLSDLRAVRADDRLVAEARVVAPGIPIRGPLLGQVLEEESAERLMEEFDLRGMLDIDEGRLHIESRAGEEPVLSLSGLATLSDVFVAVGAPVSIRSARLDLQRLEVQGERVRGWGRIRDLYGEVVGRAIEQADLLLSYHGSQLTVETFEAGFCRGRLTGIGGAPGVAPGPAFAVELRPPYRFQLGLALEDVEVRPLLQGVFAGDLADRGYLDGRFGLRGELDRLLEIEGSGHGRIQETVLWSVPVVRDLFSQLGLDETAVFDEMQSSFRVQDGAVVMEDLLVRSPLLKLRGGGRLRFDGTLDHDLEVRYSLVDRFGPFGSLIYSVQNTLLAISIRGDMSRPRVLVRGVLGNPFLDPGEERRALPYPDFSSLEGRF